MIELAVPDNAEEFDRILQEIPNRPAVFLLAAREGQPYLARTNVLRRRLLRLLGPREKPSRLLNLSGTVTRMEYQLTGSRLESQFLLWELARRHLGPGYREAIRLRLPPYVKLILTNQFPRTHVTSHIGKSAAVCFGPFRNRSTAAAFDAGFLDLFQLRRCQEDLFPSLDHPGCMYGEMGRCLRPCQMAVGVEEYRGEAERVADFLRTNGRSLLDPAKAARDRMSAEMDFEGAAMLHQRIRKIEDVLGLIDEMARDVNRLHAVAILPSAAPDSVELGWMRNGRWQGLRRLEFTTADGGAISLDTRLREIATSIPETSGGGAERMEQIAILSRWFYSSWRDGEMLLIDDWDRIPYRKLVNAVSRVAKAASEPPTPHPSNHS